MANGKQKMKIIENDFFNKPKVSQYELATKQMSFHQKPKNRWNLFGRKYQIFIFFFVSLKKNSEIQEKKN